MRKRQIAEKKELSLLLNYPENHGLALAAWRMPKDKKKQYIVGLSKPMQVKTTISDLPEGFVVNKFADQHPVSPYFIPADIVINNTETRFAPHLNDQQIDALYSQMKGKNAPTSSPIATPSTYPTGHYELNVQLAVDLIQNRVFDKVMVSRYKDIQLRADFSVKSFFDDICEAYPHAFCSVVSLPNEGIWISATPELLISSTPKTFKTVSLAGTKKLEDDNHLSEVGWKQKDIEEQAFVSRYIVSCFKKLRLREFEEIGPKTVKAGKLAHLKTVFEVDKVATGFNDIADQMLDLLHPTSAVCGMPLDDAVRFINENEDFDRSFFSGFLGPVNQAEETSLFVNLRCMNIRNGIARLFAGAGITADSDPKKEFLETELKMETLLRLIRH